MESNPQPDTKSIATSGYNEHAKSYDAWALSRPQGLEIRQGMVTRLFDGLGVSADPSMAESKNLRVLELGAGAGDPITLRLAANPAVESVVANDISSSMLNILRERLNSVGEADSTKVKTVEGDMMALDFEPGSLNAVIALYSIIHLEQKEQVEMIARCYRWLKPGTGHMLCNFGSKEDPGKVNDNFIGMQAYWSSLGEAKSVEMAEAAGFEVVSRELMHEAGDAEFLWVILKKGGAAT